MDFQTVKQDVELYLDLSRDARDDMALCQDFYDNKQWTSDEKKELKARYQHPTIDNKIKEKVNGLLGYAEKRKTEIRAYPRNKDVDSESATLISKAIDFVVDENYISSLKNDLLKSLIIAGVQAVILDFDDNKKSKICIREIKFDRFYFDPHSTKDDFSDACFLGGMIWLSEKGIKEMYPNADISKAKGMADYTYDEYTEDKPMWSATIKNENRFLITEHYYRDKDKWYRCVISGNDFLEPPAVSQFVTDDGKSLCPIIANSLNVDRDNNRYGDVISDIFMQRELNARRSKALHLLSSRQTKAVKGAIADVDELKDELAKPDGHIEILGDTGDFEIIGTSDFASGQLQLYQDTKEYFNTNNVNGDMAGNPEATNNMSGHAIGLIQSGALLSKEHIFQSHDNFLKRVYETIWYLIKQAWKEETYLRIFDDYNSLKWVGFNVPMTFQSHVQEILDDDKTPLDQKQKTALVLQQLSQTNPEKLNEIVYIKNNIAEMFIDITMEVSQSSPVMDELQFKFLTEAMDKTGLDITELLLFSGLPDKFKIIDAIKKKQEAQAQQQDGAGQLQQQMMQLQAQLAQAQVEKEMSIAELNKQKAINQALENQKLAGGQNELEQAEKMADIKLKEADIEQKHIENMALMVKPLDSTPQINT
jgi:hypothetical protein